MCFGLAYMCGAGLAPENEGGVVVVAGHRSRLQQNSVPATVPPWSSAFPSCLPLAQTITPDPILNRLLPPAFSLMHIIQPVFTRNATAVVARNTVFTVLAVIA